MARDRLPPTPRQRDLAAAVAKFAKRHGYGPSLAELADELEVCQNRARDLLIGAADRGLVTWTPGVHRSLRVNVRRQRAGND